MILIFVYTIDRMYNISDEVYTNELFTYLFASSVSRVYDGQEPYPVKYIPEDGPN